MSKLHESNISSIEYVSFDKSKIFRDLEKLN